MTKKNKIIDLTFSLHDGMPTYPSPLHVPFESNLLGSIDKDGRETRSFKMGSHCGTHIDAPKHFIKNGKSIVEYDVNDLVGEALLIDLGKMKPNSTIKVNDFKNQLEHYNKDKAIRRVLFRTNWSQYWGTDQYYKNWPYFEKESINYIIDSNIKLIGLDFPSPDCQFYGTNCSEDSPNHKLLFNSDIILAEYLTNLNLLDKGMIYVSILPLKLVDFDGAPARVTAYNL